MAKEQLKTLGAVVLGAVLLVILIPFAQFLTLGLSNSDLETAAPVGWAVGLLVSLVLVAAVCRAMSRFRLIGKQSLVIVYCMLTIGIPMMNMGLVRCLYMAMYAVQNHYVGLSNNTYRTAYQAESPDWFPVVPTRDGLAWNKADRLLRMLVDDTVVKNRKHAQREISLLVTLVAKRLHSADPETAAIEGAPEAAAKVAVAIEKLGPDEASGLRRQTLDDGALSAFGRALKSLGRLEALDERAALTQRESAEAAEFLTAALADVDEHEVAYLPAIVAARTLSERTRFDRDRERLSADERQALDRRLAVLEPRLADLSTAVTRLGEADFARVRARRQTALRQVFNTMEEARFAAIRTSFIYRSSAQERKSIFAQDGRHGTPNQNVGGLMTGYAGVHASTATGRPSFAARIGTAARNVPWHVWAPPTIRWGIVITGVFLFLMCLAEWLRRKWVDRENLAFPLVEIADNIIRHDYDLESAEDVTAPALRPSPFNGLFWTGMAVGALVLALEALGHYGITSDRRMLVFPLSETLFTSGFFRYMDKVFFVLSPVVVGLLFLVSLEVSFSIWVVFFVYRFTVAVVRMGAPNLRDSLYTGWGGGMNFPFEGEQLLGACLCLSVVALAKTWHTMRKHKPGLATNAVTPYVPARLATLGLTLMPLGVGWMLWDLGVTNVPMLAFTGVVAVLLAVAHARVRAETGLPTQHTTYEFTKLPLVFGLTGFLGARVYTLFISLAFLPVSLLFRSLPQQLENIELARRNRVRYSTIAAASLVAFVLAFAVGAVSFLVLAYLKGAAASGDGDPIGRGFAAVFAYPMWVSHFLGEAGLGSFTQVHGIRVVFIAIGATVVGTLVYLRQRFMRFPINPIAYVLILLSTYFVWVLPYTKSPDASGSESEASWIWGSALVAWLIKKLIVKYGGMTTYRRAKPLFVGLAVGGILCVFVWNVVDLAASLRGEQLTPGAEASGFIKTFMENTPFSPWAY